MSYVLKRNSAGGYMFNLKATNGEVILTSESYSSRQGAFSGIESVQSNGTDEKNFEIRSSKADQPYFVLKAKNHEIIGTSEMYSSKVAAEQGIKSVIANSPSREIKEE